MPLISIVGAPVVYVATAWARPHLIGQGPEQWGIVEKLFQPGNLAASTLLFFNVVGFMKGWIVPKYVYDAAIDRANRMEQIAMKATDVLGGAIGSVEKTTDAMLKAGERR